MSVGGSVASVGGEGWFVCCCLPVVVWFLFWGVPLPLGPWGGCVILLWHSLSLPLIILHVSNRIVTNIILLKKGTVLCFSLDDFKITLGVWLYISAVSLTSARAHLLVNILAESSHFVNQCLSYCTRNMKRFLLKT